MSLSIPLSEFFTDPMLGGAFHDRGIPPAWRVLLKVLDAEPLTESEQAIYRHHTSRTRVPTKPPREMALLIGRRGLKTTMTAGMAVREALCRDHSAYLPRGGRAVVMVVAADKAQAGVAFDTALALIESSPLLRKHVVRTTAEEIELDNGIEIAVYSGNFRRIRGRTVVAFIGDEACFWMSDTSASPDVEVYRAVKPATLTVPTARIAFISSPWRRSGLMWDLFSKHWGQDESEDCLVWRGTSLEMNPWLPAAEVEKALADDPVAARAEYLAEWRDDIAGFLAEEWIADAVDAGCYERAATTRHTYECFVDPSGGKRDSFTAAIAHKHEGIVFLDVMREWRPPFDPDSVVEEIAKLLKPYGITLVVGDAYAGTWVSSNFQRYGIRYTQSELNRSELYLETGPLLAQGRVRLVENPRLVAQLRTLERRTASSGRDRIDHLPGSHDDLANAAMGAVWLAERKPSRPQRPPGQTIRVIDNWRPFE
jgi:hypothetical protein